MKFLDFLKKIREILFGPDIVKLFEEITPDYIEKQKLSMRIGEYQKWLGKKLTLMMVIKKEREEKGLIFPKIWDEKIDLIRKEIEKIKVK